MPASRLPLRLLGVAFACLLGAACDKPQSIGQANNILVAAPDTVWSAVSDEVLAALEPRIRTVRDERIFEVASVDPRSDEWPRLRNVRHLLLIGEPADPWVAEALEEVDGPRPTPPAVVQARNVWALNQRVTILLLPPGSGPDAASSLVGEAGDTLVQQYERYSRTRMFASGVDSLLADSLRRELGFSLTVPRVYRVLQPGGDALVFRNDNPDPSQLIREIDVAWRPAGSVPLTPEAALEWRMRAAEAVTNPPQVTSPEIVESRRLTVSGHPAVEVQGVWSNPAGEWPAAGPFITRLVQCPERTYLVDAWLYAPGKPKYEYMIQLQTILDTFRCDR